MGCHILINVTAPLSLNYRCFFKDLLDGTSARDLSVEISHCRFDVGRQNDASDSAGEYAEDRPSDKAEGEAEETHLVSVHHLL